jgi:colanic acid/amylovoran biosynthesis glycosyltransferase
MPIVTSGIDGIGQVRNKGGGNMHIGVIASMKKGLEHFIYREISYLEGNGARISLFPTKYQPGLYNAKASWSMCQWRLFQVILAQPWFLIRSPVRYLRLLGEAIALGAVADCLLAWYFSPRMADVDVIYATFGDRKFFVGYFCKRIVDKPLAVTVHAYELYDNPNPRLFRRALAACDQIITISNFNQDYLAQHFGVDPAETAIVRYSLDLNEYRPADKFIVLIVGFFVERKGHEILLRALKKLDNPNIELWVVGDEGVEDTSVDVRGLVRQLALDDQVAFFGRLSGAALKAVYHACDVFCLPCRVGSDGVAEGFPNVLIEAMACGKPVLTTRHVEIPRIIPEILVDENDVDGLAAAIDQLYHSASLGERLGRQNRELAERHFSTRNVQKTYGIFEQMVRHTGQPQSEHGLQPDTSG